MSTQQCFLSQKVNLHKQCHEILKSFMWKTVIFSKKKYLPPYIQYKFVSLFRKSSSCDSAVNRNRSCFRAGDIKPLQVRRVWVAPHVVTMFPTFVWKWKLKKKKKIENQITTLKCVGCLNMCICYGLLVAYTHFVDLTCALYWQPVTADESLTEVVSVENAIICKRGGLYKKNIYI